MKSALEAALEPVSAHAQAPTTGATAEVKSPERRRTDARSAAAPELATTCPASTNVSTAPAVGTHCRKVPDKGRWAVSEAPQPEERRRERAGDQERQTGPRRTRDRAPLRAPSRGRARWPRAAARARRRRARGPDWTPRPRSSRRSADPRRDGRREPAGSAGELGHRVSAREQGARPRDNSREGRPRSRAAQPGRPPASAAAATA
jgi:hypothetical protein